MTDVIIITAGQLFAILNSLSVLLLILGAFFLLKCKEKVLGTLKKTFTFFILAVVGGILIKGLVILSNLEILSPFNYDFLAVIPLLFFLLGIIGFYKSITSIPTAPKHHHRRKHHRRR